MRETASPAPSPKAPCAAGSLRWGQPSSGFGVVGCWHEDPDDGYENDTIAGRARGAAFDLHDRLRAAGADVWVQPVVVLWADFEQRSILQENVAWVRGDEVAVALARQPVRFPSEELERLSAATRAAVQSLRQQAGIRPAARPRSAPA